MPELASALAFRLFGTRRLAIASSLWLAGIALLLSTLPGVISFIVEIMTVYSSVVVVAVIYGLILFILPGIIIAILGIIIGIIFIVFLIRGYLHLSIRCYNWLDTTYHLAREDVARNAYYDNPLRRQ